MMDNQLCFDIALLILGALYLLGCKFHLSSIMPKVSLVYSIPGCVDKHLNKKRLKITCVVVFSVTAWVFLMYRGYCAMQAFDLNYVTCLFMVILVGLFGAYTLILHSIFSTLVTSATAEIASKQRHLEHAQ